MIHDDNGLPEPDWHADVWRRINAGETYSARPWWQERICLVAAGLAIWSLFATAGMLRLWHAVDVQQQRAIACEARIK